MGKIVSFTDKQVDGLSRLGIAVLHVEVGDDGSCHRELGLNAVGAIVHRIRALQPSHATASSICNPSKPKGNRPAKCLRLNLRSYGVGDASFRQQSSH